MSSLHGDLELLFERTIPFRFLPLAERQKLAGNMDRRVYVQGETVLAHGISLYPEFFFVQSGSVGVYDPRLPDLRNNLIPAGSYFGERGVLFKEAYRFDFIAEEETICYAVPAQVFLGILRSSRAFAQALGSILLDKQGIFAEFSSFSAEIMRAVNRGFLDIRGLLRHYRELEPALHPLLRSHEIDFGALLYAVRRLPENVTRNHTYLLTDDLPTEFSEPELFFTAIESKARRRDIWEMLPGKSMVLLRSGMSDMVDIITLLCLYAVEAVKIRSRLHDPFSIRLVEEGKLQQHQNPEKTAEIESSLLEQLDFSPPEIEGLKSVWPRAVLPRLSEIVRHRESINIDFRRHVTTFHRHRSQAWTHQVADAAKELLGFEPADLPEDVPVYIISSNDHSVANCLNPDPRRYGDQILQWGKEIRHPYTENAWENTEDLIYAMGPDFWRAHPGLERCNELECGLLRLSDTASTGIQVQLVNIAALKLDALDRSIPRPGSPGTGLIINIDYAFGEQAEDIIRNLILLFGRNLAGINVLGKAGALVGRRGDILIPDAFIEQASDRFYPLSGAQPGTAERLARLVPGRDVHSGPILTVAGTLMQNRRMLYFYRHIWGCIGLEMEGTFYYRQLLEAGELGVIPREVPIRFLYYVSDLPLAHRDSLSVRLHPSMGIPPLYGITREILTSILS
ncbi:cyclic nucleotide-binding domain-containing protein [Marispirochaeta aestuarii]|uniref:cyclic nucleotide-binding domain-containing protein n=1 Tax=Marispirochaeta aestuarii TaxID=1963862 RepID=UPI0029C65A60|nr:cyclic nucleotide-binding domain-containing protein [Marispirochaeta aestuarii]